MNEVVVGTRGSALATTQTNLVINQLQKLNPEITFRTEIIETEGDRRLDASLPAIGGKGVFIKEIENALIENRIDLAVHSLKDMPTEITTGLTLGAILEREDPRDALISRYGLSLSELPHGAVIGTGSPRRACQLLAWRDDLNIKDIRGNVGTRLRKLDAGEYDAILLAVSGLKRLGMQERITEFADPQLILPAVGQGALAIEIRSGANEIASLIEPIQFSTTHLETTAERAFLAALGGGCSAPIAAFAEIEKDQIRVLGMVAYPNGANLMRDEVLGNSLDAEILGKNLAANMLADGADEIIESIHHVD